jgi:1,6-anhydro-N-acetylmuramate kinase
VLRDGLDEAIDIALAQVRAELADARQEMGHLYENERIRARVIQERNAERTRLETELVSARQENEQLREGRDQAVDRALELAKELAEVRSAAGEKVRAVLAADSAPAAEELYAYDAWSCLTESGCGSRYTVPDPDHRCGPLTAVRVSITHREEEPTA